MRKIKKEIFRLKCSILRYKLLRVFDKMLYYILYPIACIYGVIIACYGISKGMTIDEIEERYIRKYQRKILDKKKKTTK